MAHPLHRTDELLEFSTSCQLVHVADTVDTSWVETDTLFGQNAATPADPTSVQDAFRRMDIQVVLRAVLQETGNNGEEILGS